MELKKRLKQLSLLTFALFLAGFSGQEKFVELEGYLNGRSSARFRKIDTNVKAVLDKGTRGEILEKKKMTSGNYGFRVKVLSGAYTGKTYWVYYNVNQPTMALYDSPPQTWDELPRETASVDNATGTETTAPTPGIDDTDKISEQAYQATKAGPKNDAQDALDAIAAGQQELARVAVPSARPDCTDCSPDIKNVPVPATEEELADALLGGSTRQMNPRCATFMNRDGKFGELGKQAMNIMSDPRYIDFYTKPKALGAFCPQFDTFTTDSEKLQAWTWFWAALANEETQCVQEITHPTHVTRRGRRIRINPQAGYGFFALEKSAATRARRGDACRSVIGSGVGQLRCAIDIMKKTTLADGQTASGDRQSYWGPVRRGNSQIMPHMKRFKACF